MINNLKLKIQLKNQNSPNTPLSNEKIGFLNMNSCPIKNNKYNFNYLFYKNTNNNLNKIPINFNNNLINNTSKNEIQKNIIQNNLNSEFVKIINPSELNENHKTDHIQKNEEKNKKVHPIFQQINFKRNKNYFPKIKQKLNSNAPFHEENNPNHPKSNNDLPLVKNIKKYRSKKSKSKRLFHNKSGGNIKINIDCSIKPKLDENDQNNVKIINNILVKKISANNNIERIKHFNNNKLNLRNMPINKEKKLIDFFYKEEPNLNSRHNKSMEDFILIKSPFLNIQEHNLSLFALFDGHGGSDVAEYIKNNFCDVFMNIIMNNQELNFIEILKNAIRTINIDLEKLNNVKECGSTGTIVLIDNDIIYCVNVGDSKCFYINNKEAIQMTEDHNCKKKIKMK